MPGARNPAPRPPRAGSGQGRHRNGAEPLILGLCRHGLRRPGRRIRPPGLADSRESRPATPAGERHMPPDPDQPPLQPVPGSRDVTSSRYTAFCCSASCCPALAPRGRTTLTRPQSVQPQPTHAGSSQYVELLIKDHLPSMPIPMPMPASGRRRAATSPEPGRDRATREWRSACPSAGRAARSAG